MKSGHHLYFLKKTVITALIFVCLFPYEIKAQYDESSQSYWAAVLIEGMSLVVPAYSSVKYFDRSTNDYVVKTHLGSGLDLEFLGGRVLAFGVESKLDWKRYMKFEPGVFSVKLSLGLGIPTDSEAFGGIYVGADGGGGYIAMEDYMMLGYCYGGWAFIGNDKIGLKVSFDRFLNNEDPDCHSLHGKVLFGKYFSIGIDKYKTIYNEHHQSMFFINIGLCIREF